MLQLDEYHLGEVVAVGTFIILHLKSTGVVRWIEVGEVDPGLRRTSHERPIHAHATHASKQFSHGGIACHCLRGRGEKTGEEGGSLLSDHLHRSRSANSVRNRGVGRELVDQVRVIGNAGCRQCAAGAAVAKLQRTCRNGGGARISLVGGQGQGVAGGFGQRTCAADGVGHRHVV